jgi:hypothetical protein
LVSDGEVWKNSMMDDCAASDCLTGHSRVRASMKRRDSRQIWLLSAESIPANI